MGFDIFIHILNKKGVEVKGFNDLYKKGVKMKGFNDLDEILYLEITESRRTSARSEYIYEHCFSLATDRAVVLKTGHIGVALEEARRMMAKNRSLKLKIVPGIGGDLSLETKSGKAETFNKIPRALMFSWKAIRVE